MFLTAYVRTTLIMYNIAEFCTVMKFISSKFEISFIMLKLVRKHYPSKQRISLIILKFTIKRIVSNINVIKLSDVK